MAVVHQEVEDVDVAVHLRRERQLRLWLACARLFPVTATAEAVAVQWSNRSRSRAALRRVTQSAFGEIEALTEMSMFSHESWSERYVRKYLQTHTEY